MQYEAWRITFQSDEAAARSALKQFQELSKGKCLHQIQEPAPVTAMDALREAEAALEVAMARILKADPGHSICVTSEAKALVAVRAALAAPAPMLVAQPQLHAALFAARGALQHMKEGGKPTQSLLNEAIAAIDSVAVTQAAPAAVAVPDAVRDAEKLLRAEAARLARIYGSNKWYGFSAEKESYLEHLRAAAALAATPAAAPAVLPEPVPTPCRSMFATQREYADAMAQHRKNWAEIEAERAMLATGGQAQAQAVASIYVTEDGQRECDDWKVPLPVGRNLLYAAPQAQADARDAGEFWGVLSPCGEGVFFRVEADARWTHTGHGSGSDGFGVPTIGEAFRECYEDEELELVRVHIAAIAAAKPHEEPAA